MAPLSVGGYGVRSVVRGLAWSDRIMRRVGCDWVRSVVVCSEWDDGALGGSRFVAVAVGVWAGLRSAGRGLATAESLAPRPPVSVVARVWTHPGFAQPEVSPGFRTVSSGLVSRGGSVR